MTLRNNTNNWLESSWKQLKDIVDHFSSGDECVASIMYYQTLAEMAFFDQRLNKLAIVRNAAYDSDTTQVAKVVSQHAAELIYAQYSLVVSKTSYEFYEGLANVFFIKSTLIDDNEHDEPNAVYHAERTSWSCSCLFMSTRILSCRHGFYIRKSRQLERVIPVHLLPERCLTSAARSLADMVQPVGGVVCRKCGGTGGGSSVGPKSQVLKGARAGDRHQQLNERLWHEIVPAGHGLTPDLCGDGDEPTSRRLGGC